MIGKTFVAKPAEVEHKWYVVDASGKRLGILASAIAKTLTGKNKPIYTPNVDTGDFVVGEIHEFLANRRGIEIEEFVDLGAAIDAHACAGFQFVKIGETVFGEQFENRQATLATK